jgi:hypothetical protein
LTAAGIAESGEGGCRLQLRKRNEFSNVAQAWNNYAEFPQTISFWRAYDKALAGASARLEDSRKRIERRDESREFVEEWSDATDNFDRWTLPRVCVCSV